MTAIKFCKALMIGASIFVASGIASAQERATKEEAVALLNASLVHVKKVGLSKALDDFSNDKAAWTSKDLYVGVMDWKGNSLAHGFNPKLVGRNLWELKDPSGTFIIQEMIKMAQDKGEGWVNYQFADPLTKKIADKTSFVKRIPGVDAFVLVGVYR